MKEVKFRGQVRFNGTIGSDKMIEGKNIRYQKTGDSYDVYINGQRCIPETVGQFTGLHDIHGKEIFEGDIIRGDDGIPNRVVGFSSDYLGYFVGIGKGEFIEYPLYDVRLLDVIGNVYENPGLIKEKGGEEYEQRI